MGRVIEILGHPDDFGVDVEIIIRKHHLPHHFPLDPSDFFDDIHRGWQSSRWRTFGCLWAA